MCTFVNTCEFATDNRFSKDCCFVCFQLIKYRGREHTLFKMNVQYLLTPRVYMSFFSSLERVICFLSPASVHLLLSVFPAEAILNITSIFCCDVVFSVHK